MIIVVDALNKEQFRDILDDMFRLRSRVFGERLGWNVKISNGMEIDEFDALDPAYVIGLDEEGHVISCARALQTTGPHMLSDVFHAILDGEPPMRSATLWESTRFCVDTQRLAGAAKHNAVSYATCELMAGFLEYARQSGISDIVTVIDPVMDRVLKRSDNAPYGYVGSKKPMGKVSALAALLDCTEERINRVRAFAGIEGRVLMDDAEARRLFNKSRPVAVKPSLPAEPVRAISPRDILEYCTDQIRDAVTQEERAAAAELVSRLAHHTNMPELRVLARRGAH